MSLDQEAGKSFSYEEIKNAVETNKPAVLFLCQVCALSCWRTSWHRAAPAVLSFRAAWGTRSRVT